jgi:hypothetical protein
VFLGAMLCALILFAYQARGNAPRTVRIDTPYHPTYTPATRAADSLDSLIKVGKDKRKW